MPDASPTSVPPHDDVFARLAALLDRLPGGFPPTPGGVEQRILRRLFTPADAELALHLTLIPEEARVVAWRAGRPVAEVEHDLQGLLDRGLIYGTIERGTPRYGAMQFVVGFWEGQVNRLDAALVADFEEYLPTLFDPAVWRKAPQMRVVPVGVAIRAPSADILPYEIAEELVRSRLSLSVSNCICRQERKIAGAGCDRPMESCLGLGDSANYITRSGRGRRIDVAEAIDILQRAEESGLVLQASNSRQAVFVCTCCGCCCGVLRTIKRQAEPAALVSTAFVARVEAEHCTGCAACAPRCQLDALSLVDGTTMVDARRCIGCGLCVGACPEGALSLARKPAADRPRVPKDIVENYLQVGRARGKYGPRELAGMLLRSRTDRLRAR